MHDGPVDRLPILVVPRPLDEGDSDGSQLPALDRLNDSRIAKGLRISLHLQLIPFLADAGGDIHRQDERQVDLGGTRRCSSNNDSNTDYYPSYGASRHHAAYSDGGSHAPSQAWWHFPVE